ncbi:hypothetical protein C5167_046902 [Papaver somniferum]|uniref:Uncharacterized protein n=1 Tax=Papaver somniferum TaxID=3469 RepID=A0A4Y7LJ24_PAPSO|nr:hypothetical protein C5167_046902 [Papaver somniferum]
MHHPQCPVKFFHPSKKQYHLVSYTNTVCFLPLPFYKVVDIPVVTPVSTTLFRVASLIPPTFSQLPSSNCTPKKTKAPSSYMDPRRRRSRPSLDGPFIYNDGTKPYTVRQNDSK